MDQQDQKREQIIEGALKRFAHFGLNKTTMNEIANDLSLSKSLLYYYFPDKINLYAAVLSKVFTEITSQVDAKLANETSPEAALKIYIETRQNFIEKYFPILDFNKFANIEKYQDLKVILDQSNASEINHLKEIIEIGIKSNTYLVEDATYTANLLFDALQGLRKFYMSSSNIQFGVDRAYLDMISRRQKEIVYIFLKGLSKP
ncbi:TetR/AcrR family transcriptional regulator [Pedobacter cryophilus]|uniref:TetR/AcrR family transcriptional regulator n=1 Tax=Pedobacter cryophilus TaxID=2571271 RepID=A0A4U1BVI3_9SPHI|nr:TetR/AcrR family transcriptional regulator [Pedobacter cryophilus]TKB96194.1 TetR/AcrR family transcriptional regulator [Pedobacter cryophilus]